MTALSADRKYNCKTEDRSISLKVAASTTIYCGSMVSVDATGYAIPAAKTTGTRVIGVAKHKADNSSGSDGDIRVTVAKGVHAFVNDTDAIAQADIGKACFVVDDQTVADEGEGSQIVAGIVDEIDPITALVWVKFLDADSTADDVSPIETVTSGAISVVTRTSLISITGTAAYTLAAGAYEGQRKTLVCSVCASTPAGTITPATYATGTSEHMNAVGDFLELEYHDADGWTRLQFGNLAGASDIDTVTTGALSLFTRTSLISVSGTKAYTLANGLFEGQRKSVVCSAAASTPIGTLTPATYADGTSEHIASVGDYFELEYHATGGWKKVAENQGGIAGETVTSGALSLFTKISYISVTGTQAYTLADGLYVGQEKYCRCTVAASTPNGTLTPASPTGFATADFDATEEAYIFIWTGAGWECPNVTGGALS